MRAYAMNLALFFTLAFFFLARRCEESVLKMEQNGSQDLWEIFINIMSLKFRTTFI